MPSTLVHLFVAHEIEPTAPDLFWIGNFAPDYTDDREKKSFIHLRKTEDRMAAMEKLYKSIDFDNPFERGWFLHLFTDACWDKAELLDYKNHFEAANNTDNWFISYRQEIKNVSHFLYNSLPWAKEMYKLIASADLSKVKTDLPITLSENESYRDRVVRRHLESNPNIVPGFYTFDIIESFVKRTSSEYIKWIKDRNR
jgi:hypothetical protein